MITRGYFIGDIIDNLAQVCNQVEMRSALGLTDLSLYLENFFREILNEIHSWELQNLNSERSNEPGLDLGDSARKVAVQVTATKTKQKIEDTLAKITPQQIQAYERFIIFVTSRKQASYSTISNPNSVQFDKDADIWDIDDICRQIVALKIDRLESLQKVVRANTARIKIELELPNEEGIYPTNITEYIEQPSAIVLSDMKAISAHFAIQHDAPDEPEVYVRSVEEFARRLRRLARISRDFYLQILRQVEDVEDPAGGGSSQWYYSINRTTFNRKCRYPLMEEELLELQDRKLIDLVPVNYEVFEGDAPHPAKINVPCGFSGHEYLLPQLLGFANLQGIPWNKFIVNLDFSDF